MTIRPSYGKIISVQSLYNSIFLESADVPDILAVQAFSCCMRMGIHL